MRTQNTPVAAYSYKEVMYRDDFLAAVKPAMEQLAKTADDYDGDAGYDGDGWLVAAYLIEQKDAEIIRLRSALERIAKGAGDFGTRNAANHALGNL